MRILSALFICSLVSTEDSLSKETESTLKSVKLKEDVLQSIPTSYQFKYSTGQEGPAQLFREEYRDHDGTVKGKYGYVDPNGKLRIIEYKAGAGGYSASGDIGPDSVAQNEAQSAFENDPTVRAQNEAWKRPQTGNWGSTNWNSPPVGWSSVDPLWNVGALPKTPNVQPAQPQLSPSQLPRPQPPKVSTHSDQIYDEKIKKSWDNSKDNNWQNSDRRSSGGIDWNTWNANQQTWTKPTRSGAQQWTSSVTHQWPQSSVNSIAPPSNQWSNGQTQPQMQAIDKWRGSNQGPTARRWSQTPQTPATSQWKQFDRNAGPNDWSQPLPVSQPSSLPDLKEKWTGISTGADKRSNAEQWNKPLAGLSPPINWQEQPETPPNWQTQQQPPSNWQAQPPTQIQWGQPAPTTSIADKWAQRMNEQNVAGQITSNKGQFDDQPNPQSWQSGVQYNSQPSAQWPRSISKVARIGEQAQPLPAVPQDQSTSNWQQPTQPNQAQFEQPNVVPPIAPTNIGSNEWPTGPAAGGNLFAGQPYVHFRIDHTVDPNQPPLRYQYSY